MWRGDCGTTAAMSNYSEFEFRLRPVATPSGFRYHVDMRPASRKHARVWRQLTELAVTKAEAQKVVFAASAAS